MLSAVAVRNLKGAGLHHDGGGLYLQITPGGARSWLYRYKVGGKQRHVGLGPYPAITLEEARRKAAALRAQRATGVDPLEAKRAAKAAGEPARGAITFEAYATKYIEDHRAGWRNAKHAAQWTATLRAYVYPTMGAKPVAEVSTDDVLDVLRPIWSAKPETASRVRGRIENILDAAKAAGLRAGENPALYRGHLSRLLPRLSRVRVVEHHAALPFTDMPRFMAALSNGSGMSSRAFMFAIFTAARTSEALGATWAEIDMDSGIWTVPAERMKAGKVHRVPLSAPALALLQEVRPSGGVEPSAYVFPGEKAGRPLSNMAFLMRLRRMGRPDLTAHGFRSTFRDWAAETTGHPHEVVEMALAHTVGSKVEAAYRRGDLFEKRRALMDDWAAFAMSKVNPPGPAPA